MAAAAGVRRWGLPLAAAILTVASVIVVGAIVARSAAQLGAGAAWATAMAGSLAICIGVPVAGNRIVVSSLRKRSPETPSRWSLTLIGWSAVVLILTVVGLPSTTRVAMSERPTWFVPGSGASGAASAAPSGSAVLGANDAPDGGVTPPPALPLGDRDHSPQEIFAGRADAVVVVRTRSPISPSDPRAEMYGALGLRWMESSGSGFVTGADGIVVTNFHVAGEATAVEIRLHDGRAFPAVRRLSLDKAHDLTVLGIDANGLATAPLAPDDAISTGMRSIAIGSPLGMEYSVTDGIISAVRDMQGTTFLQMQTTIAPGSSGGPLFDTRGRVIGVDTGTRGAGLNLAVHVKYVRGVLALARTPVALQPYAQGVRVATMEFEGGAVTPIDRLNYEEPLSIFAQGAESCLPAPPAGAALTVTFRREGHQLAGAQIGSSLGGEAMSCLRRNIEMTSSMIGKLLAEHCRAEIEGGAAVSLAVGLTGFAGGKTMQVRYVVPKPGDEPVEDDGEGEGDDGGDDDGTEAVEVP